MDCGAVWKHYMDGLCQAKALCQVFSGDELLWFKEAILRHLHLIRWIAKETFDRR